MNETLTETIGRAILALQDARYVTHLAPTYENNKEVAKNIDVAYKHITDVRNEMVAHHGEVLEPIPDLSVTPHNSNAPTSPYCGCIGSADMPSAFKRY